MNNQFFAESAMTQLVIDPINDCILTANNESALLTQYSLAEVVGFRASKLFAPCLPDFISFSEEVMEKGRGWSDILLILTKAGSRRVETHAKASTSSGPPVLLLSMCLLPEMEQKRSRSSAEKHFQSGLGEWSRVSKVFQEFERDNQLLLDAAGEGIYGVDANGITTFINPAAEAILGYKASELAGKNMHSTIHHSHRDGTHFNGKNCPIFEAFRDGKVHTVEDDVFWSKAGIPVDVEYTSTPIREGDCIVGAVVVFRDVSQKKADKQKLIAALAEVNRLKNRLELENAYLQEEINSEFNHHRIIGRSEAVKLLLQQIEMVAPTRATVLINGESGTGKELVARAIHETSDRRDRPLIRVNCAAIPQDLFESEFFGHAKGAFTGATSDRPGRFELADGGTLFLDEVGEIPLHLQGKLLRVLQEQQFERVGESKTRHVSVRILAATNKDLLQCVKEGTFREDLYFRLNVFPIYSAPLRDRKEDIPYLTQHFLEKACKTANKPNLKVAMSEIEKLQQYDWPGNIRELENVIERQVILAKGSQVIFDGLRTVQHSLDDTLSARPAILTTTDLEDLDRKNIIQALKACDGKVSGKNGAAAMLNIKPSTLSSRIRKYEINVREFKTVVH